MSTASVPEPAGDPPPVTGQPAAEPVEAGVISGRRGKARVAVVTVIDEEQTAALQILGTSQNVVGTPFYVRPGDGTPSFAVVVTRCPGRSNIPAKEAVDVVVEAFRPSLIVLVGIAGGIAGRDNVALGDVILADYIDYYEYAKLTGGKLFERREPLDHPSLYVRHFIADPRRRETAWHSFITEPRPNGEGVPKALLGNIVAGEKLLADRRSSYQKRVLSKFDKALAVDMESWGFARGVFGARTSVRYNPQCLVIRGISDLVDSPADNQTTRDKWRVYAAQAAAAFTRAVLEALPADL